METNESLDKKLYYKHLHFSVNVKLLIPRGYTFQKLYASNYKTYRKKFRSFTIWLWVKGKTIEINDWYTYTNNVIECYKNNYEQWKLENSKLSSPRSVMVLHANHSTGEVKLKDYSQYYEAFLGDPKKVDEYYKKYEDWSEIILSPNSFNEVLEEIDFLIK
jgi:hypothetical protein